MKCQFYCPAESTVKALEARISMPTQPMVGDELYLVQLAPDAGCGSRDYWFVVTGRTLKPGEVPIIHVKHVWKGHE